MTFFSPLVCSRKVRTIVKLSSVYHISISSMLHIFRMFKRIFPASLRLTQFQSSLLRRRLLPAGLSIRFFFGRKSRNSFFGP